MLRILLWSFIVFFLIRFIWRIVSAVFRDGSSGENPSAQAPPGQQSANPPATFQDIQEAKFKDLPNEENQTSPPADQ